MPSIGDILSSLEGPQFIPLKRTPLSLALEQVEGELARVKRDRAALARENKTLKWVNELLLARIDQIDSWVAGTAAMLEQEVRADLEQKWKGGKRNEG